MNKLYLALNDHDRIMRLMAASGVRIFVDAMRYSLTNELLLEECFAAMSKRGSQLTGVGANLFFGITLQLAINDPELATAFEPARLRLKDRQWVARECGKILSQGIEYYLPTAEMMKKDLPVAFELVADLSGGGPQGSSLLKIGLLSGFALLHSALG